MIKVDLITGFLGAGKTTFLKKYARYYMDRGLKVGILENDYGAINVDMLLLNELRGERCELEMVAGGCDMDCHRRRFKTKLISMGMSGYDRVLIEPSGIFDTDEFFDALREEPLDRWYEIGNVIAIVDAKLEKELSPEAEFYLASQVANAGQIVLSRTQLAGPDRIRATLDHLSGALAAIGQQRDLKKDLLAKDWEDLTEEDFEGLSHCQYHRASYRKLFTGESETYSTVYFLELPMSRDSLKEKLPRLFSEEENYGRIFRIKGFFREGEAWCQVNATRQETEFTPIPVGQQVLIVIGEDLQQEKIEQLMKM